MQLGMQRHRKAMCSCEVSNYLRTKTRVHTPRLFEQRAAQAARPKPELSPSRGLVRFVIPWLRYVPPSVRDWRAVVIWVRARGAAGIRPDQLQGAAQLEWMPWLCGMCARAKSGKRKKCLD